jgi:hypothetical protein
MRNSGCEYCDKFWTNHPNNKPQPIVNNIFERFQLFQCTVCRAFWEANLKSARIIREITAYSKL